MMWGYGYGPGMFGYGGFGMGIGMLFAGIFWIAFWGLIVFGAIHLLRRNNRGSPEQQQTPLEVLEHRYARGEIGRDEYLEKKRDMNSAA